MLAFAAAGLAVSLCAADPAAPPQTHDWLVRNTIPILPIVPTPHVGHDYPADSPVYTTLYAQLVAAGLPVGIMLRDDTAPFTGGTDPLALDTTIQIAPQLDYVFADFETPAAQLNVYEMVFRVRFAENPNVWWAWIGAYAFYPGAYDESAFSPFQAPREFDSAFYLNSGLDVAMPNTYPYAGFQVHTDPAFWGDYLAPNVRSALLWAPLARFSVAKSSLPPLHRIIPWVAPFVDDMQFGPVDPPPIEDAAALLQHMRLRGADGYYVLESFIPGYTNDQYRVDMLGAWHALDIAFGDTAPTTVLNQTTDKQGGVQWSGVQHGSTFIVLVSNLGNSDVRFTLPGGPWPRGNNVLVPKDTHALFVSGEPPPPPQGSDLDGSGFVDAADLGVMLGAWGPCPTTGVCVGDINGDGVVDAGDIGQLLSEFSGQNG